VDSQAIIPLLKHADSVVGEPYDAASPAQTRNHHVLEPLVQHIVQEDVRQQRGNDPALRRSFPRDGHDAVLEDFRAQPFVDQAPNHAILDPLVQGRPELPVVDRPEVIRDVQIENPLAVAPHDVVPETFQRLVRRTAGPEPIGASAKVLLVHGLQKHHHRALGHLVLERGDAQRTPGPVVLRNVRPSYGRRSVSAGFQTFQQVFQVRPQVPLILLSGHAVDSCRAILAGPDVRLVQPAQVEVVMERSEAALRMRPGKLSYPSLFR